MSERPGEASGAAVAAVVIVVILGFIGLLVVGGIGAMFFVRSSQMARVAEMEARMQAERAMVAELQARETLAEAQAAVATAAAASEVPHADQPVEPAGPVILLQITAAGEYKLGENNLSFEELKDALLAEHVEKGPNLVLAIVAEPETPYKRVDQAIEAAECASISKLRIRNTLLEPAANKSATP